MTFLGLDDVDEGPDWTELVDHRLIACLGAIFIVEGIGQRLAVKLGRLGGHGDCGGCESGSCYPTGPASAATSAAGILVVTHKKSFPHRNGERINLSQ